jgi:enoyl-CoA hydratase/carnithine racemase
MLLGPNEAVAAGLADQVVPAADLVEAAIAQAAVLSSQPAFRVIKKDLRHAALAEIAAVLP